MNTDNSNNLISTDAIGQPKIRLIIADDMAPIREYLYMVLSHERDLEVVDTVETGAKAVDRALAVHPDVLLIDLEMETPRAGVEAIRKLTVMDSDIRCVVLTHFSDDDTVFAAFEAGATDYILKNSTATEILDAVRAAAYDMSPIRPLVARMIRKEFRAIRSERAVMAATLNIMYSLSSSELGLLRLLAEGKSKAEIAQMNQVEPSTVRIHIGNILRKFEETSVNDIVNRLNRLKITKILTCSHGDHLYHSL